MRVLSENGILGFIFFILALLVPFFQILKSVFRHRAYFKISLQGGDNKNILLMLISLYWQFMTLLYSLTGNPLTAKDQLITYFIFTAIGIGATQRVEVKMSSNLNGFKNKLYEPNKSVFI